MGGRTSHLRPRKAANAALAGIEPPPFAAQIEHQLAGWRRLAGYIPPFKSRRIAPRVAPFPGGPLSAVERKAAAFDPPNLIRLTPA